MSRLSGYLKRWLLESDACYLDAMCNWASEAARADQLERENQALGERLLEAGYELLVRRPNTLNAYAEMCREAADQWWYDPETGMKLDRNHGEMFMLMVSEISEAMEADRKGLMDDHLPHRTGVEAELADTLIRIFDYAGENDLDLDSVVAEKLDYNARRADHKPENRIKEGGKKW